MSKKESRKNRSYITLILIFCIGLLVGVTGALLLRNNNPTVLVWAADKDVKVPDGLVSYLERTTKEDCKDYKGTNSVMGVTLFSIYETSQNRLAKMTYGCGNDLTKAASGYIVAYKEDGSWHLTRPTHYFLNNAPDCTFLSEHDFPASFESQCETADGSIQKR